MDGFSCLAACLVVGCYRQDDINREVVGLNERHFIPWPYTELIIGKLEMGYGARLWTECYSVKCRRWSLLKDGGILGVELVITCSVVWLVCLVVDCSL